MLRKVSIKSLWTIMVRGDFWFPSNRYSLRKSCLNIWRFPVFLLYLPSLFYKSRMHWESVIYEVWSYKLEQLSRPVSLWGDPEEWMFTHKGLAEDSNKAYIEQIMPDKIRYNMKWIENQGVVEYFKIIFSTFFKIAR